MIIDAIIFNNELDILDVRLHELDPVVDKFVIVESLKYHGSNRTKASNFRCHLDVFRPFLSKIEYVLLDRLDPFHAGPNDSWPRENFHRNAIVLGLESYNLSDNDVVLISDCDEIPRASMVLQYIEEMRYAPRSFTQDLFYYDVNNYLGPWHGTVGAPYRDVKSLTPQGLRNRRDSWPVIANGGWHFSYFGGLDRIKAKLENFAHACEDSARLARHWLECGEVPITELLDGGDLFRRPETGRKERRSHDDPRLPAWLREHISEFRLFTEDGLRESLCPKI